MPADAKDKIPFLAENRPRGVHPPSVRYAIAGAWVVLALALSQALGPLLGDQAPLIFFVAASFIAGWSGGLGPGLTALVTGLLLGDLFFMRSWQDIRAHNPSDVVLMMIYAGVGAIGLAAISSLHRARFREERIRETAWRLRQDVAERSREEEALRQAKEKLDFALEAARLCTWDLNLQTGEIEWCSESGYNTLLGLKPEGVRQRLESFLRRVHPEDRVLLKHTVTNCARKEIPCDVEFRVLESDGSVRWFLAKGKLLRAGDGKGVRMSGILMDITERKQAQERLAESEQFVRSAFNTLGSHIAILDQDGVILEVNQAWRDFAVANQLGIASSGIGANYLAICDRAQGAGAREARSAAAGIRAVARGDPPCFSMEYSAHSATQQRWFILRAARSAGDGSVRLVVSHQNVTALKLAEEAVRQSEARVRAQYTNFPIPTYTWQRREGAFVLVDFNEAAKAFTHGNIADLISKTAEELYPDVPEIIEEISRCFRDQTRIRREMWYQFRTTGEHKHLDVTYVYVPPDMVMIHCDDITERKQTEEALRQNQERYHALAEATFDAVVIHENAVALEVNHSLCEMFGYEPGEVLGRNMIELLVEPESIAVVLEHLRAGSEEPYEAWVRRKDGSKLLVELRARNLDYKGRSVRVVSAHDITQRKHSEQALLESERVARRQVGELESLYESATVGRCFLDTNLRFVRINKWLAGVLGRPPAEHIGHSVWELAPGMANTLGPVFRKALETGVGVKDLEFQLPLVSDPAQSPRDWLVNLDVLKENGHVIGVNTVISEITERKRMEQEVRRTLSLLTTTLEATADGILVVDLTGKVVRYNQRFAAMWRIPEAVLAAQDDARMVSYVLDQLSEPDTFLRKVHEFKNQPEAESQDELRFTDGRVFERHSHPQRLGSQVVGRVWSFHDVTERKRIEEAVRRSEAQLHEMADAMPQIVWTARPDGRIEFVNERWFEHGDLPGAEPYLDQAWRQLLHPDDADQAVKTVHTALQNGQAFQLQVRIKQRGDGYHWHLARALPWRDEAGRISRWFGTCTDIEDQKRTEHTLQAAKEQLDHHARTLERRVVERTAKLEETIRSLEGILYHIAHDLRAPLRAMAGFAQMLEESPHSHLDEEEKTFTQRIVTGAKRMDCLIQDLLAYGRLGHSRMALARMPLGPALERVLHKLAMKIKCKNADIQVIQPMPAVRADANVLDQVLVQLLTNAITFVPPNVTPRVRIWAEQRGSMVRLWIQDNGIGIEREHWERIFQVFERLHRVDEYTGTGIGLAIVHKGIERLGGTVGVESKPGEGSRFWLELRETASEK